MNSIDISLTIAIPTYNRSTILKHLLSSIASQLDDDNKIVEILVLDNCSNDSTAFVVHDFNETISNLRYIRQSTNIGSDNNFVSAYRTAIGTYVWILGDDELLFQGAIKYVLKLIREYDFGCAYLSSIATTLDSLPSYSKSVCSVKGSPICFNSLDFANYINYRLTFVSGAIINKGAIQSRHIDIDELIEKFSGTNLVHLSWVCSSILARDHCLYINTPLFASTIANSGGYNPVQVFIVNLGKVFECFFLEFWTNAGKSVRTLALLGWFPKVSYDLRFSNKYNASFNYSLSDFPVALAVGLKWMFFKSIFNSPRPISLTSAALMKISYRVYLLYIRLCKSTKCKSRCS